MAQHKIKIVGPSGDPINLSNRQKNFIYSQAKALKGDIRDSMCTHTETMIPNEANVKKMHDREFKSSKNREKYNKMMRSIGADPKDCSTEELRKRR